MQHKPRTTALIGMAAAGTVFAFGACSGGGSSQPTKEQTTHATQAPSSPAAGDPTGQNGALLKAGRTALNKVSDTTLISIETEGGDKQWEVQLVTSDGVEHEMNVAADGRKVVAGPSKKSEDSQDHAKHRKRVKAAKLDYREAAKKVTKAVPGKITELNIDTDDDTTVWEADVQKNGTKYEVSIDASSGKVLQKEKD